MVLIPCGNTVVVVHSVVDLAEGGTWKPWGLLAKRDVAKYNHVTKKLVHDAHIIIRLKLVVVLVLVLSKEYWDLFSY